MRRLLKFVLLFSVGCTTTPKGVPDFSQLQGEAPFFRALYRLQCCQMRGLNLVVARGESGTLVEVAGGPSGVGFAVWVTGQEVLQRTGQGCLRPLGPAGLPLPDGSVLPVSEQVFASLLSGRLPAGGQRVGVNRWSGWVAGSRLELEVAGGPTRWVRGWLWACGNSRPVRLLAQAHHGRVPGKIQVLAPGGELTLVLLAFQPEKSVAAPSWLGLPRCEVP